MVLQREISTEYPQMARAKTRARGRTTVLIVCIVPIRFGGIYSEEILMSELVDGFNWSETPLGPKSDWPQSLKTVVHILLTSRYAMWMGWGPELTFLYNDTYGRVTLGKKHP
jgi:hypothetical protein